MRKIVSLILLCSLLPVCFSGCSIEDGNEDGNIEVELNNLFTRLQEDSEKTKKLSFFIEHQDLHYELKNSGKYNDEKWKDAAIIVTIDCNYDLATDEAWYKACSNTDVKTLNIALFNEYSHELSEGHFTPWGIASALYFEYDHSESTLSETLKVFYSDYAVLAQLVDLEYVNGISIQYFYSVPGSYFDD